MTFSTYNRTTKPRSRMYLMEFHGTNVNWTAWSRAVWYVQVSHCMRVPQ